MVGLRYQWATSRLAEVRGAFGVTALSFTTKDEKDPASDISQLRFAPEFNLGLGNLKLGISYAVGGSGLTGEERVRFLVGADLYKLISGNNLEVF